MPISTYKLIMFIASISPLVNVNFADYLLNSRMGLFGMEAFRVFLFSIGWWYIFEWLWVGAINGDEVSRKEVDHVERTYIDGR